MLHVYKIQYELNANNIVNLSNFSLVNYKNWLV